MENPQHDTRIHTRTVSTFPSFFVAWHTLDLVLALAMITPPGFFSLSTD